MKEQDQATDTNYKISHKKVLLSVGLFAVLATTAFFAFTSTNASPEVGARKLVMVKEDETPEEQFKQFVKKFGKVYKSLDEEKAKFEVFKKKLIQIAEHNSNSANTFQLGINQFSDIEFNEFKAKHLSDIEPSLVSQNTTNSLSLAKSRRFLADVPAALDWRTKNAVGPVKAQGECGSCWAFASAAAMEGAWAIAKKNVVSFSEQFLINCATEENGCKGGTPSRVANWVPKIKGIPLASAIPYTGTKEACPTDWSEVGKMTSQNGMIKGSETDMKEFISNLGPVAAGMNAPDAMLSYKSGIFKLDEKACDPAKPNHAVAIVGYGTDQQTGQDYWIIKNSWGADWGEGGYMKLFRGANTCGITAEITAFIV